MPKPDITRSIPSLCAMRGVYSAAQVEHKRGRARDSATLGGDITAVSCLITGFPVT